MASPEPGSDRARLRSFADELAAILSEIVLDDRERAHEVLVRAFEIGAMWGVADYVKNLADGLNGAAR